MSKSKHVHRWSKWSPAKDGTWLSFPRCKCAIPFRVKFRGQVTRILNAHERAPKYVKVMYQETIGTGEVSLDRIGSLKDAQRSGIALFIRKPRQSTQRESP